MSRKQKKKIVPESYRERTYREIIAADGLVSSYVRVQETDLHILAPIKVEELAGQAVYRYRNQLENYIADHPDFLTSLVPCALDPLAPPIVREMLEAGQTAGVGPMAAVAGAVAEFVGRDLLRSGVAEVMVENGGDIFIQRKTDCVAAIFAGQSPLSSRLGIRLQPEYMPLGVCTSSGTVGHSLSHGIADAVTVVAPSTFLADAVATRLGNEIKCAEDIDQALEVAMTIPGITGVVMVMNKQIGAWGKLELVKTA